MKRQKINRLYHPLNILKHGRTLQKFYRSVIKSKLAAPQPPPAPAPELVKVEPSYESEPSTPSTSATTVSAPSTPETEKSDIDSDFLTLARILNPS